MSPHPKDEYVETSGKSVRAAKKRKKIRTVRELVAYLKNPLSAKYNRVQISDRFEAIANFIEESFED